MTEEDDQRKSSGGRREYDDPNKALNEHIVANDKRLTRFFRGAIIAFAFIGILTTVALVGFGVVLNEQQDTADKLEALVKSNQALTLQNKRFAEDIQQQRRDSIRDACVAQNKRHDGSVAALVKGSDEDQANAPNEDARKEIRRRRDVTIALLDALAPVQDCEKLVKESVQGG